MKRVEETQTNRINKKGLVILAAVFVLVFAAVFVVGFGADGNKRKEEPASQSNSVIVSEENKVDTAPTLGVVATKDEPSFESVPETQTETSSVTNEKLEAMLQRAGYTLDSLSGTQLITVESQGTSAVINGFEKKNGVWRVSDAIADKEGFVGTQGVSENASEYASYTPKGLFGLGTGFGIKPNPGTKIPYFQVTEDSYWVDDVNSEYYNQHVEGKEGKDFESAEHLIDYKGSYDYAVFVEYNTNPAVPGNGSAFFLHVGQSPTAGCVATNEAVMIYTLLWLDPACEPQILIF